MPVMSVSKQQREHPLNRKASELLKSMKGPPPNQEILPILLLVIVVLNGLMDDETMAALYRMSPESVMKKVSPLLTESDLSSPNEAAYLIVEALGIEELVANPV